MNIEKEISGGYLTHKSVEEFGEYKSALLNNEYNKDDLEYEFSLGKWDSAIALKLNVFSYAIPETLTMGTISIKKFNIPMDTIFCTILFDNNIPCFINLGATFVSMDGEYRNDFVPYNNFLSSIQKHKDFLVNLVHKLSAVFKIKLKAYLPEITSIDKISIDTSSVNKRSTASNTSSSNPVTLDMDPLLIFAAFYLRFYKATRNKTGMNIDWGLLYLNALTIDREVQKDFITDLLIIDRANNFYRLNIGVKMLPLTVDSAKNIYSLLDDVWLELYINLKCNKLVINGVTNCLACTYHKSRVGVKDYKSIFDLKSNKIKYKHSKIALTIEKELIKAEQKCLEEGSYISYEYEHMGEKINKVVSFSEKTVHMSDEALLIFIENKGTSLATILAYDDSKRIEENIALGYRQLTPMYDDLLFKIFYTLFCLNNRKIIQGDLHLGNIVLDPIAIILNADGTGPDDSYKRYQLYAIPLGDSDPKAFGEFTIKEEDFHEGRPHTISYSKGKQKVFMVPHVGFSPSIIDFSRAIIGIDFKDTLTQLKFDAKQRKKMLQTYESMFPDFMKENKTRIIEEMKDFKTFFNKFAAIDGYRLCTLLLSKNVGSDEKNQGAYERISNIKNKLEDILLHPGPWEGNNPNFLALNEFSYPVIYPKTKHSLINPELTDTKKIIDIFVSNAPIVYSLKDYAHFPPMAKLFKRIDDDPDGDLTSYVFMENMLNEHREEALKFELNLPETNTWNTLIPKEDF